MFLPNSLYSFMKHCTKNYGVECGASYFFSCLLHTHTQKKKKKKCEKMSNLVLKGVRFGSALKDSKRFWQIFHHTIYLSSFNIHVLSFFFFFFTLFINSK